MKFGASIRHIDPKSFLAGMEDWKWKFGAADGGLEMEIR